MPKPTKKNLKLIILETQSKTNNYTHNGHHTPPSNYYYLYHFYYSKP